MDPGDADCLNMYKGVNIVNLQHFRNSRIEEVAFLFIELSLEWQAIFEYNSFLASKEPLAVEVRNQSRYWTENLLTMSLAHRLWTIAAQRAFREPLKVSTLPRNTLLACTLEVYRMLTPPHLGFGGEGRCSRDGLISSCRGSFPISKHPTTLNQIDFSIPVQRN